MRLLKKFTSASADSGRHPLRRSSAEDSDTFKRGRTLTGSISPHVRSPNETQADLKPSRVHVHALVKKRRRLSGIFALAGATAIGLYLVLSQFTAQAVIQATPDPSLRLDEVYSEAIDDYLAEHGSERLRVFTNTDKLLLSMQQVAPEVKSVRLSGSAGFGKSLFELSFREPIASWEVEGRRLYVDDKGVPFARNYFKQPPLRIIDQSGIAASSGQTVMSNRFMGYIGQVIGLTKQQGYTVTSIVIPEGMTRQVEVRISEVQYPFKFSSDRAAGEAVEDMVRTLQWLQAQNIQPDYVDVRVAGRAFYR